MDDIINTLSSSRSWLTHRRQHGLRLDDLGAHLLQRPLHLGHLDLSLASFQLELQGVLVVLDLVEDDYINDDYQGNEL